MPSYTRIPTSRRRPLAGLSRIWSIMPLSRTGPGAHHGGMLLIHDSHHDDRLVLRPCRFRHRLGAHLWASMLDRRLAAGGSADSGRLMATRAGALVSPAGRE